MSRSATTARQQLKIIDRKLRIATFFLKLREQRADEGRRGKPALSPEHEKIRAALAKAVSAMPATMPQQQEARPEAKQEVKREAQEVAKPQAGMAPIAVARSAVAGTVEDREYPTIGPRNLAIDPCEVRTLTQISPSTHTTGGKG